MILEYEIPKYDGDVALPTCSFRWIVAPAQQRLRSSCALSNPEGEEMVHEDLFFSIMRIREWSAIPCTVSLKVFIAEKQRYCPSPTPP